MIVTHPALNGRRWRPQMKKLALALALFVAAAATVPDVADAKRIGGGGSAGMQRSMPTRTPDAVPAKPAAPVAQAAAPATAGAAAAAAPRRSWMGPIAGLAAGLGIAALMSHLGLGAEFGNIIMMVLLAVAAFALIRFLMRRFMPSIPAAANGGLQLAGAGAPVAKAPPMSFPDERPAQYRGLQPGADAPLAATAGSTTPAAALAPIAAASVPAGFDVPAFERIAKMIFIRLQAANDAGDLNDLRAFTTPEMFAAVRLDLQERGPTAQRTDVVRVDAEVLDVASEAERQVVSVRFHGLIREQIDGVAEPFDEVWHLVKPADGSREWAIAGIQQAQGALAQAA
jgi:predicted lipid-binding transport protein (Tim44 family)